MVQRRTFLLFLERFVSQAKQIEEGLKLERSENASNRPKAAATKKKPIKERPTEDETWAMVADNEPLQNSGEMRSEATTGSSTLEASVGSLQRRMNQMEDLMGQVLQALQRLPPPSAP